MADTTLLRTARHRHRDLVHALAADLRRARLDRGLSQRAVAEAAGVDPSLLSRIEGGAREPSLQTLVALATALGTEPSVRLYATDGPRIFDRTQAQILEALLRSAHPRWRVALEVAVSRPSRGVIDAVLHDPDLGDVVATEIQGQLRRAEQQVRWSGMKADALPSARAWPWGIRGEPRVHRLLVLRSSETTRGVVRALPELFRAAYPIPEAEAYHALTTGTAWPGDAILWADVDAGRTRLLRHAPRGTRRQEPAAGPVIRGSRITDGETAALGRTPERADRSPNPSMSRRDRPTAPRPVTLGQQPPSTRPSQRPDGDNR